MVEDRGRRCLPRLQDLNIKYSFEKVHEDAETFIAFKTLQAGALSPLKGLLKIQNQIKRIDTFLPLNSITA